MTAASHAGDENGFWVDDQRVIAKTMSSSVEFGFDGFGRFVTAAGTKRYTRFPTNDLGYTVSYPGSGRTQWVAFDFVGTNFFGSAFNTSPLIQGGAHMPIFLRSGSFQNASTIYSGEGKGIFLGRNHAFWGSCGAPEDKARIFFETKVVNAPAAIAAQADRSAGAVKCADGFADKYFEDGVKYSVVMHVNDQDMAYWIYRADPFGNMVLWSSNGTNSFDYPRNSNAFNAEFLDAMATWLPTEHSRMTNDNINTLSIVLVLMPTGIGTWNLKITNLSSSRF